MCACLPYYYYYSPEYYFFFICLLTMCRALSIQNEKADIIHPIPLTSSNQLFSFPACTHLHPHTIYRDILPTMIYTIIVLAIRQNVCCVVVLF